MEVEFPVPILGERHDITDREIPNSALRVSKNMLRERKGNLVIRPGYSVATSGANPGDQVMGIFNLRTAAGVDIPLAATLTGLWSYDGTDWLDESGTPLTGTTTDHVRMMSMTVSGVYKVIVMNGVDTPKIWNGTDATYSNIGGTPGAVIAGAVVANRALYLVGPNLVKISEFNDPETIFATVTLVGGDLMIGMDQLGRTSAGIIGEESQWVAYAQSGPAPFRFERVSDSPGSVSSAAIVKAPKPQGGTALYWLANDYNIYRFDGTPAVAIGYAMQPWIKENIAPDNRVMSHGTYMWELNKIFWWFPEVNGSVPTLGVYYDILTGEMGQLFYPEGITASGNVRVVTSGTTWNDLTGYTESTIDDDFPTWFSFGNAAADRVGALGVVAGTVYISGKGDGSDNNSAVDCEWEMPLKDYAGWPKNVVPHTFETFFKKASNSTIVNLSIGYTDTLMDDPVYMAMDPFDIETDQRNDVDLSEVGAKRFVSIKLEVSASKGQVSWQGGLLRAGDPEDIEHGPTG